MGKLNRGPSLIDADHFALHKPAVVTQFYDLRQCEIRPQLAIFRPRDPEHPAWLEMRLEPGKCVIELFLAFGKKVDVIKLTSQFCSKLEPRWVNYFNGFFWCVHQDCARALSNAHFFRCKSCHLYSLPFSLKQSYR